VLGIGLGGSLLVAGCVPGLDRSSWPTGSPTPEQSGATSPTTASPIATTSAPSGSTTVGAYQVKPLPEYTGPKPLPAADGKPMLWPLQTLVSVVDDGGYQQTFPRYGFLDVTGKLVVPQRYESYQYCSDESGRAVLMILNRTTEDRAEVFDLTGRRLATLPTKEGRCAGPSYVITTRDGLDEASTRDDIQNGLFELATGKLVIPMIKGRQLTSVRPGVVNVAERKGEYFLDLNTWRKTPHPGWVSEWASMAIGAPGIAATTERDGGLEGVLDLTGHWFIPPAYEEVLPYGGRVAVAQLHADVFVLLDDKGHELPGTWSEIDEVSPPADAFEGYSPLGYLATGAGGQALFNADGKLVVPPGTGGITCAIDSTGACGISLATAGSQLVTLPEGTATAMPAGFHRAFNGSFLGSSAPGEDGFDDQVYSLATGKTIQTVGNSTCSGAGSAFVVCGPDSEVLPSVVIDADGPTSFASVTPLAEPDRSGKVTYYQVTAGKFSGIVDASGTWRYRQSSYLRLED